MSDLRDPMPSDDGPFVCPGCDGRPCVCEGAPQGGRMVAHASTVVPRLGQRVYDIDSDDVLEWTISGWRSVGEEGAS